MRHNSVSSSPLFFLKSSIFQCYLGRHRQVKCKKAQSGLSPSSLNFFQATIVTDFQPFSLADCSQNTRDMSWLRKNYSFIWFWKVTSALNGSTIDTILLLAKSSKWWQQCNLRKFKWRRYTLEEDILLRNICAKKNLHHRDHAALSDKRLLTQLSDLPAHFLIAHRGHTQCPSTAINTSSQ